MTLKQDWVQGDQFTHSDENAVATQVNTNTTDIAARYTKPGPGIPTADIAAAAVTGPKIASAAVDGSKLNYTGTPDSTTYLKVNADNTLAVAPPPGTGGGGGTGSVVDNSDGTATVTAGAPGSNSLTTAMLQDASVTTPKLADASVTIAKLGVTGTPNGSKFLRDDMSWQIVSGGAGGGVGATTNVIDVVGDYLADNTAASYASTAFRNAYSEAVTNTTNTNTLNNRTKRTINIPPGTYKLDADDLMRDLGTPRIEGLTFQGWGRDNTMLWFSPTTANQYLCTNNDDNLFVTFRDMTIYCTVSSGSFMKSLSNGGAQNYIFDNVEWRTPFSGGGWKYGIDLQGTDTNSEMTWLGNCAVWGDWTAFLYVGTGVGTSGDQFLNYNMGPALSAEMSTGNLIDMARGGNISIRGGSFIHAGNGSQASSAAQCFVRLRNTGHSFGVCRASVEGIRVEHRHNNSQIINCDWDYGNINLANIDAGNWWPLLSDPTQVVPLEFGAGNGQYPIVNVKGSTILGKPKFHYRNGTQECHPLLTFEDTQFLTSNVAPYNLKAHDSITFVNDDSTANTAAKPPVRFVRCKGPDQTYKEAFDCTINWESAKNVIMEPKSAPVRTDTGSMPTNALNLFLHLPLNAMVTRVYVEKAAGGTSTATTWSYTVSDGNSTQIAQLSVTPATGGGGVAANTLWNASWAYDSGRLRYKLDTDAKRKLQITTTQSEATTLGELIVEYTA